MRVLIALSFLPLLYLPLCQGYRLLAICPISVKSHFIVFEHLMKGLAKKGHQVDVISAYPLEKPYPNYTDIAIVESSRQLTNNLTYELMQTVIIQNTVSSIVTLAGNDYCRYLGKAEMQKLVRNPPKDPPYDAVLIEVFASNCFAIIGHLWDVPVIGISATTLYPWHYRTIAYPESLACVPNILTSFTGRMDFWRRLYNFVDAKYSEFYFRYLTREQDDIIREYFGPGMPSVQELETRLAMILINSHITINGVTPTTPAAVEMAGLHTFQDESLTLSPKLEKWMNESKDGFVYFTFGSMIMIETFPREFFNVLYASLGKISPIRVLMKTSNPEKLPTGLPKNIHTSSWMPQVRVLHHPNIKAFITHGGNMGTQEAIAYGVPMIGMPFFADQFMNIDAYVARNVAVKLNVNAMTEMDLDAALNAVLWNPLYRESARNLSRRFLDRPLSIIDNANYWVEYVIKYGSDALRSPAMDLSWWQLALIDVIGFLLLCVTITIIAIIFIVRLFIKMINRYYDISSLTKKKTN